MAITLGYSGAMQPQALVSTVQCGQADLAGLFTTPITLVPAPGPYGLMRLIRCEMQARIVTSWIVGAGATFDVIYADGSTNPVLASIPTADITTLLTAGSVRFATLLAKNAGLATADNNKPLQLRMGTAGMTSGGNVADLLLIRTYYLTEPLIRVTY
jgi:hypothetical protein